jgi:hypothetical protein
MSDIEKLADLLRAFSSDLSLRLDLPLNSGGHAWLDVEQRRRVVAVEWRPRHGFGISLLNTCGDPQGGLFEGPSEVVTDYQEACNRILSLLAATDVEVEALP